MRKLRYVHKQNKQAEAKHAPDGVRYRPVRDPVTGEVKLRRMNARGERVPHKEK